MKNFLSLLALAVAVAANAQPPSTAWTFTTQGPIRSTPVVTSDRVFLTSGDGSAYALDLQGKLVWKTSLKGGASFSSPSLGARGLAVVSGGSTLQLLDPQRGAVLWTLETGADVKVDEWDYFHSAPLSRSDRIVFGSGDGFLYSVEPVSGKVQWKTDTRPGENPLASPVHSSPVWADGTIYIASAHGDVWAVDPATGAKKGRLRLGDRIDGTPAIDGGQLFVGSRDTQFYGASLSPLKQIWNYRSTGGSWMTSSAAVHGDLVIAGSSDDMHVFAWDRKTGDLVWKTFVDGNVFSTVVWTPRAILATSGDARQAGHGHLWALSPQDGEELWSVELAGNSWATPVWAAGKIYVGDDSGVLRVVVF